jgi:hypothetical protein
MVLTTYGEDRIGSASVGRGRCSRCISSLSEIEVLRLNHRHGCEVAESGRVAFGTSPSKPDSGPTNHGGFRSRRSAGTSLTSCQTHEILGWIADNTTKTSLNVLMKHQSGYPAGYWRNWGTDRGICYLWPTISKDTTRDLSKFCAVNWLCILVIRPHAVGWLRRSVSLADSAMRKRHCARQ